MRLAFLLGVVIFASTAGELTITHGMKQIGGPSRLVPRAILAFIGRAAHSGWVWLALPLMATSFYSMLVLLSWAPMSFVVPATALSYAIGALGAKIFLGEEVAGARWVGVLLVCAGVALVAAG